LVLLGSCRRFCFIHTALLCAVWFLSNVGRGQDPEIPDLLKPWTEWVTWDVKHLNCPTLYTSADQPVCFWPSTLELSAEDKSAKWSMSVRVFGESWVPLPGTRDVWPTSVRDGEDDVVVIERGGRPVVKLEPGDHELAGQFLWSEMPQKLGIRPGTPTAKSG
jgi:hypothetical protein